MKIELWGGPLDGLKIEDPKVDRITSTTGGVRAVYEVEEHRRWAVFPGVRG